LFLNSEQVLKGDYRKKYIAEIREDPEGLNLSTWAGLTRGRMKRGGIEGGGNLFKTKGECSSGL